jgi:ribosomal protein S18 acetylase RimI-like enzyme
MLPGMIISLGFSDHERPAVAALYWQAFGQKLGRTLGPEGRALPFLTAALNPTHAYCARDNAGQLLGVAGFKTRDGALVAGDFAAMARVYGRLGALWRGLLLELLERDTEDRRFLMDGLFVAERARGQGVGSRLLEAIADEARRRGYAEVRLDVVAGNDRARALYERRGFRAVQDQPMGWLGMVFGFRSATVMVRRIG